MPSTTTETIELDRELVVQTIAELQAAGDVAVEILTPRGGNMVSDHFWMAAQNLREAVFGRVNAATDEEYQTNPLLVEIEARAKMIAADALEAHFTSDAVARLRLEADVIREKRTIAAV